jgi:anti-sigma regulatory factor (Ser/Thr protein kinase)
MTESRSFPPTPQSVGAARRFAATTLDSLSQSSLEAVLVMVSELAANCVQHARTDFTVAIGQEGGQIRVEVSDSGEGRASRRTPAWTEARGRGLLVVEQLAADWGVTPGRSGVGKTVWFCVETRVADRVT